MAVIELNAENFQESTAQGLCLVDLWAPWCGPCRMLAPVLEELAAEVPEGVKVCKLNIDNAPEIASQFGVMSIPTVLLLRDGAEVDKRVGLHPKEEYLGIIAGA